MSRNLRVALPEAGTYADFKRAVFRFYRDRVRKGKCHVCAKTAPQRQFIFRGVWFHACPLCGHKQRRFFLLIDIVTGHVTVGGTDFVDLKRSDVLSDLAADAKPNIIRRG